MRKNLAKNIIKRLSAFLAGAVILGCSTLTAQAEEKYTYCYDYWGEVQDSPDAYEVVGVYTSADLGLDKPISTTATGLTVIGNDIYLCDTGNNRIIQLSRVDREDFEVVNIFDSFNKRNCKELA